jgi:hypothetical protein
MAHASNCSTQEAEGGGPEFKGSMGYIVRPSQKKTKKKKR